MNNYPVLFVTICLAFIYLYGPVETHSSSPAEETPASDSTEVVRVAIDTNRSLIYWKGTEMWQSGKHEGTVNLRGGYLTVKGDTITGGQFVADMNSIAITDIPKDDPVPRRRLRNHLKSVDFFYVEKYPEAIFKITRTEEFKTDSLKVWGELSIRDVTKPVSFNALKKTRHDSTFAFHTTLSFNRFAWNISYQGSYWGRMTSILDNTFVDADIYLTIHLFTNSRD